MLALIPLALEVDALAILAIITALLAGLIVLETRTYGAGRSQFRRDFYGG
jgi:hypothetical protein